MNVQALKPPSPQALKSSSPQALILLGAVIITIACGPSPSKPVPAIVPESAHSILLITIDTLRADHVGVYGYSAARTPAIDGAARSGVRFDQAWATAPITLTSHASMLTGRYHQATARATTASP